MKKRLFVTIILPVLLLSTPLSDANAQIGTPFNQRDDQYRLLGLKRAKAAFEAAQAEFERQKKLHADELISERELIQAQNILSDAEVNYQQSLLAVLFEKQYVTIARAVKYQDKNGRKHVRLTLNNASGSAEFKKLLDIEDELFRSLQPDVVNDIYISLLNEDNAIISQPYEAKIEQLVVGHPQIIDFILLQDMDIVTVNLVYSNGTTRSPKVVLEKDAAENKVMVQSTQFSQEVELSGSATFDLTLELFSGQSNTFKLEVVNLPPQINRYFTDPASNARLSQFKFTESSNTRQAALRIFMPDRPLEDVQIGQAIPFYILIVPQDKSELFAAHGEKPWSRQDIEALNIGFVTLEMIPRGIGKLLVQAPQLYQQIEIGETIQLSMVIKNEGSKQLDNIQIEADLPLNWQKKIEPAVTAHLNISEERTVNLSFIPPADISPGKYEIRVRTQSLSDDQPVTAPDKIFSAEIRAETNTLGTVLVILFILGIVIGIIGFGIRLTRR